MDSWPFLDLLCAPFLQRPYICIMNTIGNIIWVVCGGLLLCAAYVLCGLILCVTVVGIPFGVKVMKMGFLALWPFGKEVTMNPGSGCLTVGMNILWALIFGWELALSHLLLGLIFCITVVGIPFGLQHFKLAGYAFLPFGCEIN